MKKAIKFHIIVVVAFAFSMLFGKVEALAVDCVSATVLMAGAATPITGSSNIKVQLKNSSGAPVGTWANNTDRFFYLDQTIDKEGLATLLTAFAMGKKVWVRVPGTTAATNSLITVVFIK